jgi:hypothetical protein
MRTIQDDRSGSNGASGMIAVVAMVIAGASFFIYKKLHEPTPLPVVGNGDGFQKVADEQKKQQAAFQESLTDTTEAASAADIEHWNGKKAVVSNVGYFTAFGGIPGFARWKDAALYPFNDLAKAAPGSAVLPTGLEKELLIGPHKLGPTAVDLLPVNSEFEVIVVRLAKPSIGAPQLICHVRTKTTPSREFFIHSHVLTVAP